MFCASQRIMESFQVVSWSWSVCQKLISKALAKRTSEGGGGGSKLMDRQGCAILGLELVPKKLIFV